ncbi:unnamed protein product [Adineta steineri]|uniref:cysteine dioxygenase n=1 Tax=Adineta steineri TaxID=433720 RepID=A0A819A7Z4_9BILA|nr:unnamed protein product [Adineta steineri]CAF3678880.1 unnamed protein product [Adineta steineri]CAF3783521.1 unnamed protein product [Adineta steineri]
MRVSFGNGTILVEQGDITTQEVDAIVGSSSSVLLKEAILRAAGNEVRTEYETQLKHDPNLIVISTSSGQLPCKRIFFIKWRPNEHEPILQQSIRDFIWIVIHNVVSCKYKSIAFPAIGCGLHGCSEEIVVKTMVKELKKMLTEKKLALTLFTIIRFRFHASKQKHIDTVDVLEVIPEEDSTRRWTSNKYVDTLVIPGQGTVEICQKAARPFVLQLSSSPNSTDPNAYSITLSVKKDEVSIITNKGTSNKTTESHHVLQPDDKNWHKYWISLYHEKGDIRYGIGEMRPFFTILNIDLSEDEAKLMKQIKYIHVDVDATGMMAPDLNNLNKRFRIDKAKYPLLFDPPLAIIPQDKYSLQHVIKHSAIPPSQLEKTCLHLYENIINFQLNTDDFPNFTDTIAKSIESPSGWCYKKLQEKASTFGKKNFKTTYLRITYGERDGCAPGHTYVIEIWPPGHFSPIHNHANASAIIRVLHGRIFLKNYPAFTLDSNKYSPLETILNKNEVIWMTPKLNQVHQLKNITFETAISIQCYLYDRDDEEHYEYFDYIADGTKTIGQFKPVADADFHEFRTLMKQES